MTGRYIVIEGMDGTGKTTAIKALASHYESLGHKVIQTRQPGSTVLGRHIRKLVKTPEAIDAQIEIDPLSRQVLFMVDCINHIKTQIEPWLDSGHTVISDRTSFISSLIYGIADGLAVEDIKNIFNLIKPPQIDKLFVLQCDWATARARVTSRSTGEISDVYDKQASSFYEKLSDGYRSLVESPYKDVISQYVQMPNLIYINAQQTPDAVLKDMIRQV